jgi:hypothetical protein
VGTAFPNVAQQTQAKKSVAKKILSDGGWFQQI